jgi:hypothetical protein
MKKVMIIFLSILPIFFSFSAFAQEKNRIGLNLELGELSEWGSDGMSGHQLFVTPIYRISDKTDVGVGAGLTLFKQYKKHPFTSSFPLYVSGLYKFKSAGITPFVGGKLGYTFLKESTSGKVGDGVPMFDWSSIYLADIDLDRRFRAETRGGLFFSPSFGILFPLRNKQCFSASISYEFDRRAVKSELLEPSELSKGSFSHHSIALRIGYIF